MYSYTQKLAAWNAETVNTADNTSEIHNIPNKINL